MAPLGEWSLEATVLDGARGMPGTVALSNRPLGTTYSSCQPITAEVWAPVRRRPPDAGGERIAAQADSAKSRRSRTG